MYRLPTVNSLDFGAGAADHERSLSSYFYRSQAFERACDPEICLVIGEKGAGKSAIFLMMRDKDQEISEFQNPNFLIATTANLREHYHLLRSKLAAPPSYVTLWKFYFASIAALTLLDTCTGKEAEFLLKFVERWEINPQKFPTLLGATVTIPAKLLEVKVGSSQPLALNPLQIHEVFASINRELAKGSRTLWIALDELDKVDVDGTNGRNTSSDLLSALMQTHSELYPLGQIRFKFFVRSDVYEGLTYVDKDHFSNAILRLRWEPEDLVIMLALRIAASSGDGISDLKLSDAEELVDQVFEWPQSISGFRQLLDQLRDGRGSVIPRDLLNFAIGAKNSQAQFNRWGTNPPARGLVSQHAVEKGLEAASQAKLNDFLTTFPELYQKYLNLQGHTSWQISQADLQSLLGLREKLDFDLAVQDFWRVGAIAKRGDKPLHLTSEFIIPAIYRRALAIKG
ncbi:MAG: hypothetical protein ABSF46_10050 [Terriglobia bacterium]|jgi:hypothetical protein